MSESPLAQLEIQIPKKFSELDSGNVIQDEETSTNPSPSPKRSFSRIEILKQGIRDALNQTQKKTFPIEIEHFEGFRPYEIFQQRMEKNNELEKSGRSGIVAISKQKLIEMLTHDYQQDSALCRVVLYTYKWYFDEKEMFSLLLERFKTPIPLNLSPVEKKAFLDSIISKIQIKVLIFIKDWFKCYSYKLNSDQRLEEIFFELLYLMFTHPDTGKWIHMPISQLLSDLENLNLKKEESVRPTLKIKSLPEIFVPLPLILSYSRLLAKQLCILDVENFKKIKVTEFFRKCWTKENKLVEATNLTNIADMSTRLSRLTSYLLLMNKKSTVRVILYTHFIDLCDQLVRLRNFNSAFAIYLGLSAHAVQRLNSLIEPHLESKSREVLENLKQLFSPSENMKVLKTKQSEASTPAVPYLGVYLSEILFIEEMKDYVNNTDKKMLNFTKFSLLSERINKLLTFKESYGFHKVDNVLNFIKGIPFIDEDQIYQLSFKILPA